MVVTYSHGYTSAAYSKDFLNVKQLRDARATTALDDAVQLGGTAMAQALTSVWHTGDSRFENDSLSYIRSGRWAAALDDDKGVVRRLRQTGTSDESIDMFVLLGDCNGSKWSFLRSLPSNPHAPRCRKIIDELGSLYAAEYSAEFSRSQAS